ncbi:MAG TPA: acetate kinase, partial [Candidatus Omnitrophota bacterium]|nr:acetate kinase [Candidatus Omnitrophota bacterium]
VPGKEKYVNNFKGKDHHEAVKTIRDVLVDSKKGVLKDLSEVCGVGHRIVHGGKYTESVLVDKTVVNYLEEIIDLAPLHNRGAVQGIRGCLDYFKDAIPVTVFDTAFHHSMPEYASTYGIPYEYLKKYAIKKYGFHGTSHRYVSAKAAELLNRPLSELKLITAHLGNGCSVAAVSGGKCLDTSMGFTPLEGLIMGTRCGDIDPTVMSFLVQHEKLTAEEVNNMFNKKSGLLGISGLSNDMRDILAAVAKGHKRAKLAYDMFVYRLRKYIGAYAAVLGNVDAVVFTAGIGENVPQIKNEIMAQLRPLLGNRTEFLTVHTNEELLIARDTYKLIADKCKDKNNKKNSKRGKKCQK